MIRNVYKNKNTNDPDENDQLKDNGALIPIDNKISFSTFNSKNNIIKNVFFNLLKMNKENVPDNSNFKIQNVFYVKNTKLIDSEKKKLNNDNINKDNIYKDNINKDNIYKDNINKDNIKKNTINNTNFILCNNKDTKKDLYINNNIKEIENIKNNKLNLCKLNNFNENNTLDKLLFHKNFYSKYSLDNINLPLAQVDKKIIENYDDYSLNYIYNKKILNQKLTKNNYYIDNNNNNNINHYYNNQITGTKYKIEDINFYTNKKNIINVNNTINVINSNKDNLYIKENLNHQNFKIYNPFNTVHTNNEINKNENIHKKQICDENNSNKNNISQNQMNYSMLKKLNTIDNVNEVYDIIYDSPVKRQMNVLDNENFKNSNNLKKVKKNGGGCFFNLNNLSCQFLLSCDKA